MKEAEKRKEDAEAQRAGVPAPKRTAASPKCHQPFHYRLRHHSNTVPASPHRAPIVVAFIIIVSNRTNQPLHLCPTSPLSISFVTTIIEPSSSTSSRYRIEKGPPFFTSLRCKIQKRFLLFSYSSSSSTLRMRQQRGPGSWHVLSQVFWA